MILQSTRTVSLLSLAMFIAGVGVAGCGDAGAGGKGVESLDEALGAAGRPHTDNDDSWRFDGRRGEMHRRNRCPMVDALAAPPSVRVGETTSLKGFAYDEDRRPSALTYMWTVSDPSMGTVTNPTSKKASFTCKKEGIAFLTFSADDGDCTRKANTVVFCRPPVKPVCGDGKVSGNETCDNSSATKCPTSCDDQNACTTDKLTGSADACNVVCSHAPVSVCKGGDQCCAPGCTSTTDSDCHTATPCGDGKKSGDETCDDSDPNPANHCPTSCDDKNPCTKDALLGNANKCNVTCSNTAITTCSSTPDQCCATGCNANTDADCMPACNGVLEKGETCDPNTTCPTSCDDGNACTQDIMHGKLETCDVSCEHKDLSNTCANGDGCCAKGCTNANDNDCPLLPCGNGTLDSGETCDNSSSTKCPTVCADNDPCTQDTMSGSAASCTAKCTFTPITTCSATADQCCAPGCNPTTDADCTIKCGDGVVSGGETCDPADPAHPCPASCDDNDACTDDTQTGSAATCDIKCTHTPKTTPACLCGNGKVDQGETCDPKDPAHACPTSCDDGNACTSDELTGSACTAACKYTQLTTPACLCGNGTLDTNEKCDNSSPTKCPASCDDSNDCTTDGSTGAAATCDLACTHTAIDSQSCLCGDSVLESSETCDDTTSTKCPTSCDDGDKCTADTSTGSAAGCDLVCKHDPITTPECLCGNGKLDPGEKCDETSSTKCPTSCDPSTDKCAPNVLSGSPDQCNVVCNPAPVTTCVNGDGCCPGGTCTGATDNDCGDRCTTCEQTPNDAFGTLCPDQLAACDNLAGNTGASNPVGSQYSNIPKGPLCQRILDCIHTTHCAQNTADTDCLCGPNNPGCFSGTYDAMTGPCKELMAAGMETNVPGDMATRISAQQYATGSAIAVVELCDQLSCSSECL